MRFRRWCFAGAFAITVFALAAVGVYVIPLLFVPKTCLLEREQLRSRLAAIVAVRLRLESKGAAAPNLDQGTLGVFNGCRHVREQLGIQQRYFEELQAQLLHLEMDSHRTAAAHKPNTAAAVPMPPLASRADVIVFVLTTRRNTEIRQAIRETWASGHDNVFFIVGQACSVPPAHRPHQFGLQPGAWACNMTQVLDTSGRRERETLEWNKTLAAQAVQLHAEQLAYSDIVELPVDDGYAGLPDKVKHMYHWGIVHTQGKWFVKADDDCFVRVGTLANHLTDQFSSERPVVIGHIINNALVHRGGKWKEHDHVDLKYYPTYPQGAAGHIVSRPIAQYIADYSDSLHSYQGEDVSIGLWLAESQMTVQWNNSQHMNMKGGDCFDTTQFLMGHHISANKTRECYEKADEVDNTQLSRAKERRKFGPQFTPKELKGLPGLAKWLIG